MAAKETQKHELHPDRWVSDHGDYLFSYALSRISSREMAEDLVQETFIAAYRARKNFRGGSSERTWLISILKRKVIDHYRKRARNQETLTDNFESPFYHGGIQDGAWRKEHAPAEWDLHDFDEEGSVSLMQIIQECISLLGPRMAASFNMKSLEGISSDEICKELGISESNLWVLLHRARLQLRECVENKRFKD